MTKRKSAYRQEVRPAPAALIICGLVVFLLVHYLFGILMMCAGIVWQVVAVEKEEAGR